jgi:hypothetical protein
MAADVYDAQWMARNAHQTVTHIIAHHHIAVHRTEIIKA